MTDPTPTQSLTPEQVKALLEGITPGRWTVELDGNICANYEYRDGKHVADWIAEVDHANQGDYQDDGYNQYSPTADNNAALICAAPALARAYLQIAEENARLRKEVRQGEKWLAYVQGEVARMGETLDRMQIDPEDEAMTEYQTVCDLVGHLDGQLAAALAGEPAVSALLLGWVTRRLRTAHVRIGGTTEIYGYPFVHTVVTGGVWVGGLPLLRPHVLRLPTLARRGRFTIQHCMFSTGSQP